MCLAIVPVLLPRNSPSKQKHKWHKWIQLGDHLATRPCSGRVAPPCRFALALVSPSPVLCVFWAARLCHGAFPANAPPPRLFMQWASWAENTCSTSQDERVSLRAFAHGHQDDFVYLEQPAPESICG